MKTISLTKLALKNVRSFADEVIIFPQTSGLRFLIGSNLAEERLGANGAGKSSIFEGLCWCLFGAGLNCTKYEELLSWEQEKIEVIAEIQVDDEIHVIHRYGPPMKVELNNKPANQEQIESLIGLSRKRFMHSVVFGQGV